MRIPKGDIKNGDTVTAKASGVHPEAIKIRVRNVEYPLLYGITVEEAKREGYAAPDFCPSKTLCGSIESRTDFESLVFDQSGEIPVSRSGEDFEKELYDRVKSGCPECLIKKDAKDLFLLYWKTAYHDMENREISKITFEVITES